MKNTYNIIGIISARGGSKRVPLKNLKGLNGRPLIAYVIKAAQMSRYLRRIIISTDHPEIKKVSLRYGAEVPFKRPKEISGSCSSTLVIQHAVRFLESREKRRIDIAVTLQPTSPLANSEDIDRCIEMLIRDKGIQSAFSAKATEVPPEWMFRLKKDRRAELCFSGTLRGKRTLRRYLEDIYVPNGAIYATRREALFGENTIISKKTAIYVMPKERSIDIDDETDFKFAEFLMRKDQRRKIC